MHSTSFYFQLPDAYIPPLTQTDTGTLHSQLHKYDNNFKFQAFYFLLLYFSLSSLSEFSWLNLIYPLTGVCAQLFLTL